MHKQLFSVAALAATALAQNITNTTSTPDGQSLAQLLGSTASLSMLASVIKGVPGLGDLLGQATNVTVLAPSNDAFMKAGMADADTDTLQALILYHLINGSMMSDAVTEMPAFLPTMLNNSMYTNVTGGQVVEAVKQDDKVLFYSGLLNNATVTEAVCPRATPLTRALTKAKLVDTVQSLKDITIFAPNNSAFNSIGSALPNLTMSQLADILSYHGKPPSPHHKVHFFSTNYLTPSQVVNGTVAYSSMLKNDMTVPSLKGGDLKITMEDDSVFVNSAKVLIPNVLIANGVIHVIDNVLNPNNTMAMPDPTASMQSAAFTATSTDNLGSLTSGVPTPTMDGFGTGPTAAPMETMAPADGGDSGGDKSGAGKKEGAIAMAALFAGAGVYMNA
ncbi:MAG: hypothetical protein Q9168_005842 [Polycauliona sp. 1 TL-2023]